MVAVARAPATYEDAAEGCGTEEVVAEVTATPAQDSTKITTGGAPGPRFFMKLLTIIIQYTQYKPMPDGGFFFYFLLFSLFYLFCLQTSIEI